MRYIVDRLEGDVAVLERDDLKFVDVPLSRLPEGVRQHDCLVEKDGEWQLDPDRTEARKRRIDKKMRDLFR